MMMGEVFLKTSYKLLFGIERPLNKEMLLLKIILELCLKMDVVFLKILYRLHFGIKNPLNKKIPLHNII